MRRRFLSRDEWPLMAMGVMVGLLVASVMIYFFVTGVGGSPQPQLVDPEMSRLERQQRTGEPPDGPGRGLIGARERGIWNRLEPLRVVARPIRGPLSLTARNLVWDDPSGTRFATADLVTARVDARAAARTDFLLDDVVFRTPVVQLRQAVPRGDWNFQAVFEELLAADPDPRGPVRTVRLRNVRVVDGTVLVTRPEQRFALRAVTGQLPLVVLSQPGLPEPYLRVSTLEMQFDQTLPEPAQLAIRAEDGLFHFPDGTVVFDVATVLLDGTRLASAEGVWNPADPGFGVTATGLALDVRFEDVAFMLPPAFPATGTATFAWSVRPLPGDRTEATLTQLEARTNGSLVTGSLTASFGEEFFLLRAADLQLDPLQVAVLEGFTGPLPWGGALRGRVTGADGDISFDLAAALTSPTVASPFTVGISGRALLREDEVLLQRAVLDLDRLPLAALRAMAPNLPLEGAVTGSVVLTGMPTQAPLAVDVRLELGAGVALLEGTVDLRGAQPAYDLRGRLLAVRLPDVLAPEVPPVSLTANFTLAGSGFDPAVMDAAVRLDGRFAGWETGPADSVSVQATVRQGVLDVQTLGARLATAAVTARGNWRFLEPQSGAITYAVDVSSLRPFGPYLPVVGDSVAAGSILGEGTVSGTLDRIRLAGDLTATDVRAGQWQAALLVAEYDIAAGGTALPVVAVQAMGRELGTPTAGAFREATLELNLTSPRFVLQTEAIRMDGGLVEIVATGSIPEDGPRIITLERALFDLEDARWALAAPTTIRWIGDEWHVDGLLLEDLESDGRLAVDGRILPMVGVDLRFEIAALPTADVQQLVGLPPRVTGLLWAEGVVVGAADAPHVQVQFRLEDGVIEELPVRDFSGTIAHADSLTRVQALLSVDTVGYLDLDVSLPSIVRIGGTPVFELVDGVPLAGRLSATEFGLAALAALAPADIRDVTGLINAEVVLSGTADAPVVAGEARLAGGAMRIMDLNQRWEQISGDVGFDGRRLLIRDLRARSDGWAVVGGHVVLERLDQPVADITVEFDRFRPMGVDNQRDAALFGRLALAGPPLGLRLTGNVQVDDGYVVIPQFGSGRRQLVDITGPAPVMGSPLEGIPDPGGGALDNLVISNLVVVAGDGAWFMAEEARVQLAGRLVVNKVGTAFPVTGTLTGNRGQYTLLAGPLVRRFDIVDASVRFLGNPEPNPVIDITARRTVFDPGGQQLDVNVRITGTLDNPRLSLAGTDVAGIAESELLSFLVFGQPSFALGGEFVPGENLLEQAFVGGFAELLAIELERNLGGFGFDIFQIRLGRGPLAGLGAPTLVLGRQLRDDVFITVETGLNALFGGAGSNELPNHWAVRLEWAFDSRSRATLAWEPVYSGRAFRGALFALPLTQQRQQFLLEVRRRWTY
ncbi:MAG TPA: translocation/assembly module TamB domain-containing protein [Longimicrobiales bacterium]|nr:translocation/assembly module TamB domain-containing protein [Longimicrobiales bacterium]